MSMGLYIPDLRLPADDDFELWIAVRKDGSFTYNVRGGWQDGKQKAVPVSPHGRLIDADRLKESLDSFVLNTQCHYKLTEALVWVRNELLDKASTVIPASKEGE